MGILRHPGEWPVSVLRAWYYVRELGGRPKRVPAARFDAAPATMRLAGSPWTYVNIPTATTSGTTFYVTDTTWARRLDPEA